MANGRCAPKAAVEMLVLSIMETAAYDPKRPFASAASLGQSSPFRVAYDEPKVAEPEVNGLQLIDYYFVGTYFLQLEQYNGGKFSTERGIAVSATITTTVVSMLFYDYPLCF